MPVSTNSHSTYTKSTGNQRKRHGQMSDHDDRLKENINDMKRERGFGYAANYGFGSQSGRANGGDVFKQHGHSHNTPSFVRLASADHTTNLDFTVESAKLVESVWRSRVPEPVTPTQIKVPEQVTRAQIKTPDIQLSADTVGELLELAKIHASFLELERHKAAEATTRLWLILTIISILVALSLITFAPPGREVLSYWIGGALLIFAAGAAGYKRVWGKAPGFSLGADQDKNKL